MDFTRSVWRGAVGGADVVLVGVAAGDDRAAADAAAFVRASIRRQRPRAVVLERALAEAGSESAPLAGAVAAAAAAVPSAPVHPGVLLLPPLASTRVLGGDWLSRHAAAAVAAAAADEGAAVGARVLTAGRHPSVTLARVAPQLSAGAAYACLPSAVTGLQLPPGVALPPVTVGALLCHVAARDWPGLADACAEAQVAAYEADPLWAGSQPGRAAAVFNHHLIARVREGHAGGGGGGSDGLRDALARLQQVRQAHPHPGPFGDGGGGGVDIGDGGGSAALCGCSDPVAASLSLAGVRPSPALGAVLGDETESLLAYAVAAAAADAAAAATSSNHGATVVAVVDRCHLAGVARRLSGRAPQPSQLDAHALAAAPPWHAARAVAVPAATGVAAVAAARLLLPRRGRAAVGTVLLAATGAGAMAVSSGVRELRGRLGLASSGNHG